MILNFLLRNSLIFCFFSITFIFEFPYFLLKQKLLPFNKIYRPMFSYYKSTCYLNRTELAGIEELFISENCLSIHNNLFNCNFFIVTIPIPTFIKIIYIVSNKLNVAFQISIFSSQLFCKTQNFANVFVTINLGTFKKSVYFSSTIFLFQRAINLHWHHANSLIG